MYVAVSLGFVASHGKRKLERKYLYVKFVILSNQ